MIAGLKTAVWKLLGKDPDAVIVTFLSADDALAEQMYAEVRSLIPERRHFTVAVRPGSTWQIYRQLRKQFRGYRIGLAPVLFTADPQYRSLRRAAFLFAPGKILAFNERLERHHLKASTPIASLLFWRGVPLDRIFLRPWKWKRDRSTYPKDARILDGRPLSMARNRIALLTPYFPYPLSHGGAVRIFNLIREMADDFDVYLFAFAERETPEDLAPLLGICAKVILVPKPRYREPRWSSLRPPEVAEFAAPLMHELLDRITREDRIEARQVEYTYLAPYGGAVLVEHDVTFDLFAQVYQRDRRWISWWNFYRWRRFELAAVKQFKRVVVMAEKDRQLLGVPQARVVPNGVDLARYQPEPEIDASELLFIGSFRHFPNIVAYRFFVDEVLPLLANVRLTVVAGPEPWLHWREHTGSLAPKPDHRIRLLEFVRDVRPLYLETNVVVVPTLVSAGTNVKVLEALAMDRAVVATTSGCWGLGLTHAGNIWIADTPADIAKGIALLLADPVLRRGLAHAGRDHAVNHFDWRSIGETQRALLRELVASPVTIRPATAQDLPRIDQIQKAAPEASQWEAADYLNYRCSIAVVNGDVAAFLVVRDTAPGEREILNVAVALKYRQQGIGRRLLEAEIRRGGEWFLEVRESNLAALNLYKKMGFLVAGKRSNYYQEPSESAIVMRFLS